MLSPQNIPNSAAENGAQLPNNSSSDVFIASTLKNGATPVITIPTIGFTPIDRVKRCGFSIQKYGAQQSYDKWDVDCGNGVTLNGANVVGNDASDTSKVVGPEYAIDWLSHLVSYHGSSVIDKSIFILDNEPNYWSGTHRDVHPQQLTYEELWNYTVAYSSSLKEQFPTIRIAGPDTSSYNAITDYVLQYVADIDAYETRYGVKLIDILDIHCYPEATYDSSDMSDNLDLTMRMRLHRELWDPSFYLESWNAKQAYYLRRLRSLAPSWLNLSCTEWNYQKNFNDQDLAGAVISLDALGVYVREGVYLSTKWESPTNGSVLEYALLDLLNNYDQRGGSIVGTTYVNVETSTDLLGAHGFISDQGQQYVLLLCRQVSDDLIVTITHPTNAQSVSIYRLDMDHLKPSPPEIASVAQNEVVVRMPPVSAALLVYNSSNA